MMVEEEVDKVCTQLRIFVTISYISFDSHRRYRHITGVDMHLSLIIIAHLSCADMQPYIHRFGRSQAPGG